MMPVSRISCSTFISTNSGASWWIDEYLRDRNEGDGKKEKRRETEGRGGRQGEEEGDREKSWETGGRGGRQRKEREVRRRRTVVMRS